MSWATMLALMLVLSLSFTDAAKYIVGDDKGFSSTHNVSAWPVGKKFHAGDVLVFNYDPEQHLLVKVEEGSYGTCIPTEGDEETYWSGHDEIVLKKGKSFFICGVLEHCQAGMRIAVDVRDM